MSIKLKDFVKLKETNPVSSYQRTVNNSGGDMDALKAVIDPQALILKQPKNEMPGVYEANKKKKKKKKGLIGMKAGGQVCRGMGAATSGGKYGKDG